MKKLLILSLFIVMLCSCGKTPINGKLDGMWQLIKIEKTDGTVTDTKEQRLYYNVQLELLGLQKDGYTEYLGRFNYTKDSLLVYDIRTSGDNTLTATPEQLLPYGINGTSDRFGIEALTHNKMVLRSSVAILSFRKF